MSKLNEKALLVDLTCHQMNFRKLDKEVTEETIEYKKASKDTAKVYKALISKKSLKPIQKAMSAAKTYHNKYTLPYFDKGARLLPTESYFEYCKQMSVLQNDIEIAVNDFIAEYDRHVLHAKERLGGLFNWSDYPDVSQIKKRFSIDITMFPIPDTSALAQLAFSNEDEQELKIQVQNSLQKQSDKAMKDLWGRLHTAVSNMASKLKNEESIFRDSLVNNVLDIVDMLPALNVTGDEDLNQMRREVEKELCGIDAGTLREDMEVRADTADTAAKIAEAMSNYF